VYRLDGPHAVLWMGVSMPRSIEPSNSAYRDATFDDFTNQPSFVEARTVGSAVRLEVGRRSVAR
jgi:hypothetical protein